MKILKQTIWDWYNQNKDNLKAVSVVCNYNAAEITLKYKSGFTWVLSRESFPNRNLIPVYAKNSKGKYYITRYEQGQDATPGPSHKRILEGGSPHKSFARNGVVCQEVEA